MMKKLVMFAKHTLIVSNLLFLFSSCKKQEPIEWNAAISRPIFHPIEGPKVVYFYKGEEISATETLTDIGNFGWYFPVNSRTTGLTSLFPDSVAVEYGGLNTKLQMCTFKGGSKLSENTTKNLFNTCYIAHNKKNNFEYITTGLAPGGRVCVWIDHIEIARFKVNQIDVYFDKPVIIFEDSTEVYNYLKHHPINYSVWDKPDPLYELDFGFCSQNNNSTINYIELISKEGLVNICFNRYIDKTDWNKPYNKDSNLILGIYYTTENIDVGYKSQLPVHLNISYNFKNKEYSTSVVLPDNFSKVYSAKKFNKIKEDYNRIIVGVENDGRHLIIWIDGIAGQKKILRCLSQEAIKVFDKNFQKNITLNIKYATEVVYY